MSRIDYNFVLPADVSANYPTQRIIHSAAKKLFFDGQYSWILQTYILLRDAGLPVRLSQHANESMVNVAHARTIAKASAQVAFMVSCAGDWPIIPWAHFHLVENKLQISCDAAWVPHWPQAGLIPRTADGGQVKRIVYCGRVDDIEEFRRVEGMLAKNGLEFVIKGQDAWHDFADVDVSLSLRFLEAYRIRRKPPTKLINAWLAGVPFVAMDEPAYGQIGTNGEDYIGVRTPEEVVQAVLRLRGDPVLYQRLVENGRRKSKLYDWAATTKRWIDLLEGPVRERFVLWKSRPRYEEARFRFLYGWWKMQQAMKKAVKP